MYERPVTYHGSSCGSPPNFLSCPRFLLFILLAALLALPPARAEAQAIEAWVQRYNGPSSVGDYDVASGVVIDAIGNVIVTGTSCGSDFNPDYLTLAYSGHGVPLWTNRYDGPDHSDDYVYGLGVDANGKVFVTGISRNSSGRDDIATIQYSKAGVPLWTNRYLGPACAYSLAVDAQGNVIVAGYEWGVGTSTDYLVIKYSGDGLLLWINHYDGPGNDEDAARAVAVDLDGNVVVTGSSRHGTFQPASDDYATIKYSSDGVPLWTNRYNGPRDDADYARAVAFDKRGNVIVTGYSSGSGTGDDYATVAYSSAGAPLWTNLYDGPGNGEDRVAAMTLDTNGNVYVTGYSATNPFSPAHIDYATIKYSSTGMPLWTNRYNGPGDGDDSPSAVSVAADGTVIVTGTSASSQSMDYATIAYSSTGLALWTNRYNGPGNDFDGAAGLALDSSGNMYVTGASCGDGTYLDYATIKYALQRLAISRQPLARTNALGTTASFSVEVTGSDPFSYHWCRQGTNLLDSGNISGVTTTNLLIANVQTADAAGYSVVVTNAYGSITSSVAQLTVIVPPNPGRFSNLSYSPETGLSFIFRDGSVGQPYRIQSSSSLAEGSWVDWESFTYNGPKGFMDVDATGTERRFYRAVSP